MSPITHEHNSCKGIFSYFCATFIGVWFPFEKFMFPASLGARAHSTGSELYTARCKLKFTLTFEGSLKTGSDKLAGHHNRRRYFHKQIRRLWSNNGLLCDWHLSIDERYIAPAKDVILQKYPPIKEFKFFPLISRDLSLETAIHFQILRPINFKGNIPDQDNIVKIVCDALKMPQDKEQIPNGASPSSDETPFYVLLEDDGLISKLTSTTDELLQPINGEDDIRKNDVRIIVNINIRPTFPKRDNFIFFSDDFEIWNHQWASPLDGITGWSNSELRARTTQCVIRMRIMASNFRIQNQIHIHRRTPRSSSKEDNHRAWLIENEKYDRLREEQIRNWNQIRPTALAFLNELFRRVHGSTESLNKYDFISITLGSLAGVDPIGESASQLEILMRQLP